MSEYFESLLPEVRKRWAAVRTAYFSQSSAEAKQAWSEIEAVVGKCPHPSKSLSSYFAHCSGRIRCRKMKISKGLVPLFLELEDLRAQAETERERSELQFALALAKQYTDKTPMKQLILQVAGHLPDNAFVKHHPHIETLAFHAKYHHAARSQQLLSRSQMVYLHLYGIDLPREKCSHKKDDDLSAAWEVALKNTQKATDAVQKEAADGGSNSKVNRRSSRKRSAVVLSSDASDTDDTVDYYETKKSLKESLNAAMKQQQVPSSSQTISSLQDVMKNNSPLDKMKEEAKEVKPKTELADWAPKEARRPLTIVDTSQLTTRPPPLSSVIPTPPHLGDGSSTLSSCITNLQTNAVNKGPMPLSSGPAAAAPPIQVPPVAVVPKSPADQCAQLFSRDAKVNMKEFFGEHIFTYVEAARALLAIGEKDIALSSLKKACEKVYETMPEGERRSEALGVLQGIYLAHYG